jgi:predicted nucleic acid-binding protein
MGGIVVDANVLIRYLGKEIRATKVLEKLIGGGKKNLSSHNCYCRNA